MKTRAEDICETVVVDGVVYNKGDEPKVEAPVIKRGRKAKAD